MEMATDCRKLLNNSHLSLNAVFLMLSLFTVFGKDILSNVFSKTFTIEEKFDAMAPQTNLQMPVVVNAVEMPSIRHKSAVTKLGLAQVILGVLSVLIGVALIVMMVVVQSRYFLSLAMYTFGEGIWCGIWIIVAGVLGMSAGKQDASVCLINCHMGFGIVAILFAALLSVESGIHAGVTAYMPFRVLSIVQAINAGISFFSLIVSTSICCCCSTPQACCGTSCCVQPQGIPNQVIVFNQNPTARPADTAQYIPANSPPAYFASVANQADATANKKHSPAIADT